MPKALRVADRGGCLKGGSVNNRCMDWRDRGMRLVTRVSLSDWLALQARIQGFKNPRLLRDRPADGAALAAKILCGYFGRALCPKLCGWRIGEGASRGEA